MVRYSHALLSFLLTCVLVQRSYCSRAFPKELETELHKPAASSVAHGDEEAQDRPIIRGANADHGTLPPSSATPLLAVAGGDGAGPQRRWSGALAQVVRDPVLHLKKLARRILVGEGTDSAAGPSCHSNNVHITCSPPPPPPH